MTLFVEKNFSENINGFLMFWSANEMSETAMIFYYEADSSINICIIMARTGVLVKHSRKQFASAFLRA